MKKLLSMGFVFFALISLNGWSQDQEAPPSHSTKSHVTQNLSHQQTETTSWRQTFCLKSITGNLAKVNHAIWDAFTIAARIKESTGSEVIAAMPRWASATLLAMDVAIDHKQDQKLKTEHASFIQQTSSTQLWVTATHLGADFLDVVLQYSPALVQSLPWGEEIHDGVKALTFISQVGVFAIAGLREYFRYQDAKIAHEKESQ